jgi:PST family polysaccharide transporter
LGVYYLPKLSSLSDRSEIRREIWNGYRLMVPLLIIGLTGVYLLRQPIVLLLYSGQFSRTADLFPAMLVGDFLKMMSWLVAYLQLAKAKVKMFVITQVLFSATSYVLSVWLINAMGLEGAVWANAVNYGLYTLVMCYLLRDYLFERYAPA